MLQLQSNPVQGTFSPEECPYETVIVDVTHRCNMACANCYIPNRNIPDLDAQWLSSMFARLPRGRLLRFVGAEPTMRDDLADLIRDARARGHHPTVVSNGLRWADRAYLRSLKDAGLQIAYLSFSGGSMTTCTTRSTTCAARTRSAARSRTCATSTSSLRSE